MGKTTIEWTSTVDADGTTSPGFTFNPFWGCTKISEGCTNCYADTLSNRYGHNVWGPKADRRFFGDKHWAEPIKWNKAAERDGVRRRVFCASMADVFERHMVLATQSRMDVERARLWELIEATPMLDWLLLTKRPENIRTMVPLRWLHDVPHNVWYGTSTENQEQADIRIPELLQVPAVVRFLSAEPLLGPVNIRSGLGQTFHAPQLHWVIAGGESGSKARPMDAEWARSIRDQCVSANVAFFFKQWGGRTSKSNGREVDGQLWSQFPVTNARPITDCPVELAAD